MDAAAALIHDFPGLADGYVALARAEEASDHPKPARLSYTEALRHGLPIVSFFLKDLSDGIERLGLNDDIDPVIRDTAVYIRRVAKHYVPGVLWSSWRAEEA